MFRRTLTTHGTSRPVPSELLFTFLLFFCSRDCCLCAKHQSVKELRHARSKGKQQTQRKPNATKDHKQTHHKNKKPQPSKFALQLVNTFTSCSCVGTSTLWCLFYFFIKLSLPAPLCNAVHKQKKQSQVSKTVFEFSFARYKPNKSSFLCTKTLNTS